MGLATVIGIVAKEEEKNINIYLYIYTFPSIYIFHLNKKKCYLIMLFGLRERRLVGFFKTALQVLSLTVREAKTEI